MHKQASSNQNKTNYSYENIYRLALDSYPGSIMIIDKDCSILYCNDTSSSMLGVSKEDLLATDMRSILQSGLVAESAGVKALETKKEVVKYTPNHQGKGMLISSVPVLNARDEVELVITFSQDEEHLDSYISWMKAEKNRIDTAYRFLTENDYKYGNMVVHSEAMKHACDYAQQLSRSSSPVVLHGESGVGKDLMAKYIHNNSLRFDNLFIPVNCATIPARLMESEFFGYGKGAFAGALREGRIGLFEIAHKGTLFLDEIGELPLSIQSKFLRVLESGEVRRIGESEAISVDTRIICATNRDLKEMVQNGSFREDLYYRLNVLPLSIPPLRKRAEDILPLANLFLGEYNRKSGCAKVFSPAALDALQKYHWPGNVRELRNIVERMVITSSTDQIELEDLSPIVGGELNKHPRNADSTSHTFRLGGKLKTAMLAFEEQYILDTFKQCDNDMQKTANALGIHISGLYQKMRRF